MTLRLRTRLTDQLRILGRSEVAANPGVQGNERLTAMAGAVLFVLLAAEGVTIPQVRSLFLAHAFIGVMLVGPLSVKLGSTGYRFFRYYAGSGTYRTKGPPKPLLRLLAPVLVASTVAVVGTGIALLVSGPGSDSFLIGLHKASFYVWFAVTTVHVLAYVWRVPGLVLRELSKVGGPQVPGSQTRLMIVGVGVTAGVVAGIAALPAIATWTTWFNAVR